MRIADQRTVAPDAFAPLFTPDHPTLPSLGPFLALRRFPESRGRKGFSRDILPARKNILGSEFYGDRRTNFIIVALVLGKKKKEGRKKKKGKR